MNLTFSVTTAGGEWRRYWTLPIAAAIGYSTAVLHTYSIGSFMAPIQEEFGWSRAQISFGLTITGLAGAFLSVPVGLMVDKLGPRLVGLVGVLLMTGSFALLGTATGDDANWIMLWSLIAFANLWLQATVWSSAVASRFEKSRGLALAITLSGASFAATTFPLLATSLIAEYGWRTAITAQAGITALIAFPVMLIFFRGAKDSGRKAEASTETAKIFDGLSVAEGLRLPAFYQLLLASILFTFVAVGMVVHFVPILTDRGAEPLAAAGVAALIGIFSLVGRLGAGFLLDRFSAKVVGAIVFLLPIIACTVLLLDGANPLMQSIAAAFFGLTVGAEIDVIAYLASRHFGLKHFGVLFGALVGAMAFGSAFGPLAGGAAFDRFGGYGEFMLLIIAFMALSSLALITLAKPRFVSSSAESSPH